MIELRISPSLIQSYNHYRTQDWMDDEKLQSSIRREFKGNAATDLGTAFHEMLEYHVVNPNKKILPVGFHDNGNVLFTEDTEEYVRAYRDLDPLVEVSNTKYVQLGKYEVQINMRCDSMKGLRLFELKTTSTTISYDKYYDSNQWMIYLWAYEAVSITYMVYRLKKVNAADFYSVVDYAEFTMSRPDDIEKLINDSVKPNIRGLIDYCETHNLMEFLSRDRKNEKQTG